MDRAPYILRPPWARLLQALFYVLAYLATGWAGLAAAFLIREWPAQQAGWVLASASVLAITGILTRLYNVELIALWPVLAGLGGCVIWLLMNDAVLTVPLVGGLMPWIALRILVLSLVARDAKQVHEEVVRDGVV